MVFGIEREFGYLDDEICPECGGVSKRIFEVFEKQPSMGCGSSCEEEHDSTVSLVSEGGS
jgi:hypothetical protein